MLWVLFTFMRPSNSSEWRGTLAKCHAPFQFFENRCTNVMASNLVPFPCRLERRPLSVRHEARP